MAERPESGVRSLPRYCGGTTGARGLRLFRFHEVSWLLKWLKTKT